MPELDGTIDCPLRCEVPEGVTMKEVPPSRHRWNDVAVCPNTDEGCSKQFLISTKESD